MNTKKNNGIRAAFGNAFIGFDYAFRTERNLKIHFTVAVLVITAGALLKISALEWAIIMLTIGAVFVTEMINTAIEYTVDLASPEKHDLARKAKDVSAGAVLIIAASSVIIGLIIFLPKLIALF
jgi:undecaprenol kinase